MSAPTGTRDVCPALRYGNKRNESAPVFGIVWSRLVPLDGFTGAVGAVVTIRVIFPETRAPLNEAIEFAE